MLLLLLLLCGVGVGLLLLLWRCPPPRPRVLRPRTPLCLNLDPQLLQEGHCRLLPPVFGALRCAATLSSYI